MGGMFEILDTASNSLKTEREAMGYAAENVANMYTPGYKAKTPILMAKGRGQSFSEMVEHLAEGREIPLNAMLLSKNPGSGSMIGSVAVDTAEGTQLYLPNHPRNTRDFLFDPRLALTSSGSELRFQFVLAS